MNERPIIFSAPMIPAILDGRKTMTRRVIKPQPEAGLSRIENSNFWTYTECDREWKCPYGQPGDRPWCKETWRVGAWSEDLACIAVDYRADGFCRKEWLRVLDDEIFNRLWEQSTQEAERALGRQERYLWKPGESPCRWRSPIFMPRWASRLILEITEDARVERVEDISEKDARAEGFNNREEFLEYFYRLHPKIRGMNPWVRAISFKRIERRTP